MLIESLKEIGEEMVKSDNQATACPVWFTDDPYPRFFLSQKGADDYLVKTGVRSKVASGHDSPETILLMRSCLDAAGLTPENNAQVKNAYSYCFE